MLNLIEDAGVIVIGCSMGTQLLDAVSHRPKGCVPFVFINADVTAGDRIRFALAHELGHMIMQNHSSIDPEREADRFAGEFLMPAGEIKRDLVNLTIPKAARLKAHWRVSMQAIIDRAKALEAITPGRHRSLRVQINGLDCRMVEPIPVAVETPTTVAELIEVHFRDCGMNVAQVCDIMAICEDEFRGLFLPNSGPGGLRVVG